jgi:hypothetical protein
MYEIKNNDRKTHQESVAPVANPEAWGSSTNEPITWGRTKARNHEEELKLWKESSSCVTDHDEEGDKRVNTSKPIPDNDAGVIPHRANIDPNSEKSAYAKEERDDEIEFTRIPIAGEDSEDYDDEDDIEEEEVELDELLPSIPPIAHAQLPPVPSDLTTHVNIDATADDIAYLIGHVDGVVQTTKFQPINEHSNRYTGLSEVEDKLTFTQNMQGMQKYDHKRKLTREEKRLDEEAERFNLLLFSDSQGEPPSLEQEESPGHRLREKTLRVKRKYTRLHASPITIPDTPDRTEEKAVKRPTRFPVPTMNKGTPNTNSPHSWTECCLTTTSVAEICFQKNGLRKQDRKFPPRKRSSPKLNSTLLTLDSTTNYSGLGDEP